MPSLKDSARQPVCLYEMMQRLGIEPGESVVPRFSLAYMTALHRCQACPEKGACRAWLDGMPQAVARVPDFCPNNDILFELRIDRPGRVGMAVERQAGVASL